nr:ketopantoate reductase C-terminal domain-containing protein [Marinicella sp. W31]MDC2876222.1 ketopantoate reductase C-terminal domain-containing protein [Marinicella sp. W31]
MTPRVAEIHQLLSLVEPEAVATDNIWGYLWGKMGYGSLLFCTALTPDSMSDAMARPEHRMVYERLGHEVMKLAEAEGVSPLGFNGFDPKAFLSADPEGMRAALEKMVAHNRKTAKTHSGIWRDLAVRKRKTEIDAQIGTMIPLAASHGLAVPALAKMVELVHDIEDGRRQQSSVLVDEMVRLCS